MGADAAVSVGPPFLWRVEGFRPSWLFGTIHFADPRVLRLPAAVDDALHACELFYAERKLALWRLALEAARVGLCHRADLEHDLRPDLLDRLARHLQGLGTSLGRYKRLRIWALLLILPELWGAQHATARTFLDRHLYLAAKRRGKRIAGLERFGDVIARLESFSLEDQQHWLEVMLDLYDGYRAAGRDFIDEAIRAYVSGSEDAVLAALPMGSGANPEVERRFKQVLLHDRNAEWVQRIAPSLREDGGRSLFVSGGVLHFLGEGSVPELLRREGFSVRRA